MYEQWHDHDLKDETIFTAMGAVSGLPDADERGKPRRGGWDFAAGLAAERLTEHLRLSGFIIMRSDGTAPHDGELSCEIAVAQCYLVP
jgi:hypothetical protein